MLTFAVIPSLAPWRGDTRRDSTPYAVFNGGYDALHLAQWAARELRAKGIRCHWDIVVS